MHIPTSWLQQQLTFSCYESLAASRTLMVEKDAVAGEHVVGLAVVDANPEGV